VRSGDAEMLFARIEQRGIHRHLSSFHVHD
jgi:hypothetical protein